MKRIFGLLFFVVACSPIQHHEEVTEQIGVQLVATLGSELFSVQKTKDLPNAWGKKDIWGGKVDEGYYALRFMGVTPEGQIIFQLTDVDILSNENVFTRYGVSQSVSNSKTTMNATTSGNSIYGTANTNTYTTHRSKPDATIIQLPENTIQFLFDPSAKTLELEGITVELIKVQDYSLSYVLSKNAN